MILLLLLAAITAPDRAKSAHFDRIDLSHVHCGETGDHRFDQLIFWRWSREDKRFYSFGFKIVKNGEPMVRRTAHGYVAEWTRHGQPVRVTGDAFIERWSVFDPEMLDRRLFPDVVREW